ncbi:uncharacterized protein LOC110848318 isoform X2 [Folsomia candida]|uniref:uncharacterized protein LOC110848318 isoform X2 n=1 Tax=Folsomia candida TaxID=158441 RepID=UPI000B9039B7|nr:uncharacterized protein LOC110848318 isoform X2 [Folsomia candida]
MSRCAAGWLCNIIYSFSKLWAATLVTLTAVLQSDVISKNIGFIPTLYDLIFLWIYDVGLFITGVAIFCGLVWKRQRFLSYIIIFFLLLQSMAFSVVVVMLTMDRFKNTGFGPIVESTLRMTPSFVISVIAGFHCLGSFIYIILLIICIHKLNEKYSPYWK